MTQLSLRAGAHRRPPQYLERWPLAGYRAVPAAVNLNPGLLDDHRVRALRTQNPAP
jgi:hypothetical protein